MKIFIACSKHFYNRIPDIQEELERLGHQVSMPNSYENPSKEEEMKAGGLEQHVKWKAEMLRRGRINLEPNDAILVLNFDKNGQPNYIGGATFLEIYQAWEMGKRIFLYHPIPEGILSDELRGINPLVVDEDLERINQIIQTA